ncbi:MAG: hypothetical protein AAF992_11690 [Bacteroidota bacterium]
MIKNVLKILMLATLPGLISCTEDNETPITEKQTGFVLQTTAGTGAEQNQFVQFFDEIPTGAIDNTQGKSFQQFSASEVVDNFIISSNISGADEGLSQVRFDLDGEAFESAFLPTTGFAGFGGIKDAENAYINDADRDEIVVYNPTTMQAKGIIDLTGAFMDPSWTGVNYEAFVVRDNDLFVTVRPAIQGSGSFYATDSAIVYHIDLTTNSYQSVSALDNKGLARRSGENWVDEQGNIYLAATLSSPERSSLPSILRIPAGSTSLDPTYDFNFINTVSATLLASGLPVLLGNFEYHRNGKAYSVVSTTFPLVLQEFLAANGGLGGVAGDPDLLTQALALFNSNPSGQFVEIDLEAQTTTIIEDTPLVNAFSSRVSVIDGAVYFLAVGGETNMVLEYDPATQTSSEVFNVTAGGSITRFAKIGE